MQMFDQKSYMQAYRKTYMPAYKKNNMEKFRQHDRVRFKRAKSTLFDQLGSVCSCGESEPEFLTIDHILNDGSEERKKFARRQLYKHMLDNLKRYRILCRNCNSGRANEEIHARESQSKYPSIGGPCSKCGRLKIVRTSSHSKYGQRKRTECKYCIRQRDFHLKQQVVTLMGGKCACCSQSELSKLTIDHVYDDGTTERSKDNCGTGSFYNRFLKGKLNAYRYQLLCWNCNYSKHLGKGVCIHQRDR